MFRFRVNGQCWIPDGIEGKENRTRDDMAIGVEKEEYMIGSGGLIDLSELPKVLITLGYKMVRYFHSKEHRLLIGYDFVPGESREDGFGFRDPAFVAFGMLLCNYHWDIESHDAVLKNGEYRLSHKKSVATIFYCDSQTRPSLKNGGCSQMLVVKDGELRIESEEVREQRIKSLAV